MRLRLRTKWIRGTVVMALVAVMLLAALIPEETGTHGANGPTARTLQSLFVTTPPVLDGLPDDDVWSEAVEVEIEVKGGSLRGDVRLRSVYTDSDIYIYAEWDDSTMSLTRANNAWVYNPVPENTVRSSRVTTAPIIDGDGSDTVWRTALPLEVRLDFGTNPGDVVLRSIHTSTHFYLQAQWYDPTFSIPRSSWLYDTGTTSWSRDDGLEDMLNLMWDIKTTGFENVGCQAKCHIGKDWSYLDVEGDIADLWHIMAGRSMATTSVQQLTAPTVEGLEATAGEFRLIGFGDDNNVVYDPNEGQFPPGGRQGDDGTASFSANSNATGGAPMYIEEAPNDWIDAMVLYQTEIDGGQTIVADPDDSGYSAAGVETAWDQYESLGASVPESILAPPSGSRGDVSTGATWKDGVWTVETARPLVTGYSDDVQFDNLDKTYAFGISTMNNTAGKGHNYITRPLHLDFKPFFSGPGEGYEDRITILWEITPIDGFGAAGCYVKCHPEFGRAGAFLENEEETGDLWHMKAARSLPVLSASQSGDVVVDDEHQATSGKFTFHGFIDDRLLAYDEAPHVGEGGWQGDEGTPSFTNNRNPDGTKPLYVEMAPTDYLDAMVLTRSEIDDGEALEVASARATDLLDAAARYEELGAIIPESIIREPTGSRGDVEQAAVWEDGTWHTEMRRALVTGHEDDVQFDDLQKTYRFSIAMMDDSNGSRHSTPGTETFLLSLYIPPKSYDITIGPIIGAGGRPVEGAEVLLVRNATSSLNGSTGSNGTFSITVPPEWTDSTVEVTVSKKGYENLTFVAVINDIGGFAPMDGSYPEFEKKGGDGDETPGPTAPITLLTLLAMAGILAITRKRGRRERRM